MSLGWFGIIDGNKKERPKDQRVVGKRAKIPTQHKTPNLRCGQCGRKPAKRYPVSEKEVRLLCSECLARFQAGSNTGEKPNFVKASKLHRL